MTDVEKQVGTTGLRIRARDIDPLQPDDGNKAYAEYVSLAPATPLGHVQATVSTGVTSVTPPSGTKRMHLRSLGQPINWKDDGNSPSSTDGFPLLADEWLNYDNEFTVFKMTLSVDATGDADVRMAFYG